MKTTRKQNLPAAAAEAASHEATLDLDRPPKEKAMESYQRLGDLMVYRKLC